MCTTTTIDLTALGTLPINIYFVCYILKACTTTASTNIRLCTLNIGRWFQLVILFGANSSVIFIYDSNGWHETAWPCYGCLSAICFCMGMHVVAIMPCRHTVVMRII